MAFLETTINQLRRDLVQPESPPNLKPLAKDVPSGADILFGNEINKRISQLSATNSALQKPKNRGYSSYNKYDHKSCKQKCKSSKKLPTPSPRLLQTLCTGEQGLQQAEQQLQESKLDVSGCYRARNIQNCVESWKKITSDRVIIDIFRNGIKTGIEGEPINDYVPDISYKSDERKTISKEIAKLL